MQPIISILIRTIVGREEKFQALIDSLLSQGNFVPIEGGFVDSKQRVEILYEKDNKEISVGAKAQKLVLRASGILVSFIDDDDAIAPYYNEEIIKAYNENPSLDCIGFQIECHGTAKNGGIEMASASNRWDAWGENIGGWRYVRTIYHKSPVRRTHACLIGYNDLRFAEDHDYSLRLKQSGLLQDEVFIDKVMYIYRYKYQDPKLKYGG